jgi:hypothetical protein
MQVYARNTCMCTQIIAAHLLLFNLLEAINGLFPWSNNNSMVLRGRI